MEIENKAGVYLIRNKKDKRVYFGQSFNVFKRITAHKGALRSNRHHNKFLQRAYNKYGRKTFEFSVLMLLPPNRETLDIWERFFIASYQSYDANYGYNLTYGGENRKEYTKQTRERISKIRKGIKISEITRERISKSKSNSLEPAIQMYLSGISACESAKKTHVSPLRLSQKLREMGAFRNRSESSMKLKQHYLTRGKDITPAIEAVKNGMAMSRAAKTYHVDLKRVREICEIKNIQPQITKHKFSDLHREHLKQANLGKTDPNRNKRICIGVEYYKNHPNCSLVEAALYAHVTHRVLSKKLKELGIFRKTNRQKG